jgi:hypothetical protein
VCVAFSSGAVATRRDPAGVGAPLAHAAAAGWSEVLLYDAPALARAAPAPAARLRVPARVTFLAALRGSAGRVLALGRGDGALALLDARSLAPLASWRLPGGAAPLCADASPCGGYVVAGCADGVVAAFALPAFSSTLPPEEAGGRAGAAPDGADGADAAAAAAGRAAAALPSAAANVKSGLKSFFGFGR